MDKSAGAKSSNDESVFDPDLYPSRTRVSIARAAVKACTHLGIEDERIRITLGLPSESVVALRNYESMVGIDDESLRRSLFVVDVFEFLEDAGFDPIRRRA
ncbi:MAG: hypothetical protein ING19_00690 [Azospirillum sp.]|nr:hypothetical protein [Azospirillum sp.]